MLANAPKGGGVTNFAIQAGRVAQVSKHQRDGTNGNLFARSHHFTREEITEDLQGSHIGGGRSLIAPGSALQLKRLLRIGGVDQVESREQRNVLLFGCPSKGSQPEIRFGESSLIRNQRDGSRYIRGSQRVTPRLKLDTDRQ